MPTYAIGDIQGCLPQLKKLLQLINFSNSDTLWFTGDLVNRGPESANTLRFVKNLGNQAITVLGNHDLHLLAVAANAVAIGSKDTFHDVLQAPDKDELIIWLTAQPLLHYDLKLNFAIAHAGIYPGWDLTQAQALANEVSSVLKHHDKKPFFEKMYGNEPTKWQDNLSSWQRWRFIINAFTRMRFCDAAGNLNLQLKGGINCKDATNIPWFELRNNDNFNIIFGHWAALEGNCSNNKIFAIDGGCVWGNKLTALRLDDKKIFQVEGYIPN